MARHYLGDSIDLHAGGIDLVFPHHENEVAQSEAFTGHRFARYWVHNGFVNINNEKMSKSKGNFLTLRTALSSGLDVRAFRYLIVSSQYRAALNFSPETLASSRNTIKRLDKFRAELEGELEGPAPSHAAASSAPSAVGEQLETIARECLLQFEEGMCDDLNGPRALAGLFQLVKKVQGVLRSKDAAEDDGRAKGVRAVLDTLDAIDSVLGIFYTSTLFDEKSDGSESASGGAQDDVPEEIWDLVRGRAEAKAAKDFAAADALRDEIQELGYAVKDSKEGATVVKI